jgi:hypothetical protein
MVVGPCRYVPPTWAEVIEERKAIILDLNEGIYVRDLEKGLIRIVRDETYMLRAHEQL